MRPIIRINYIFWKEGPLLPGLLGDAAISKEKTGAKPDSRF